MCTFNPADKKPGFGPKPTEKPSVVNSGEKGDRDKHHGKHEHGHHGR